LPGATALTRQLLAYSRKQIIQRRSLDLGEAIENNVAMLRRITGVVMPESISDWQLTRRLRPQKSFGHDGACPLKKLPGATRAPPILRSRYFLNRPG
jgi:hypothetical protein